MAWDASPLVVVAAESVCLCLHLVPVSVSFDRTASDNNVMTLCRELTSPALEPAWPPRPLVGIFSRGYRLLQMISYPYLGISNPRRPAKGSKCLSPQLALLGGLCSSLGAAAWSPFERLGLRCAASQHGTSHLNRPKYCMYYDRTR